MPSVNTMLHCSAALLGGEAEQSGARQFSSLTAGLKYPLNMDQGTLGFHNKEPLKETYHAIFPQSKYSYRVS